MYTDLYNKLKEKGVSLYAVAKARGWSWQQVAAWCKGSTTPQLETFKKLKDVLADNFGIELLISDVNIKKLYYDETAKVYKQRRS